LNEEESTDKNKTNKNSAETEADEAINESTGEKFNLPPPPSMDQILGDIEEIKARYREQTEGWNKHLDDSRREADERLQKMLAQHSK